MATIGLVLLTVINAYTVIMWARLIIDWAMVLAPQWRPRGVLLVALDLVFRLTDPPLKLVRKFVKPLRLGSVALDLAWIVILVALNVLAFLVRIVFA